MMTAIFDQTTISTDSVAWLEVLLSMSAKGLLVLLMAALLSFALRKSSAASRHLVWSLALASLLALPLLAFGLPSFDAPVLPFALSAEQSDNQPIAAQPIASQAHEAKSVATARQSLASRASAASAQAWPVATPVYGSHATLAQPASLGWATWTLMIWLVGALLILARLLIGTASVKRMARNAEPINDEEWLAVSALLAYRVGLRRQTMLLRSRSVTMPLTFGVLKPAILLPADADAWSDERREVVLLHELAHVRRRDCLTQLLAQVACALYWFNPLIWSASRNLRAERERACDDQVLDAGTRASDYADHLLDIARRLGSSNCASLAAVAIARRSQLEGRLLAILDPSVSRRGLSRIASLAIGFAVISVLLPLACLHPAVKAQAKHYERAESKTAVNAQPKIILAQTVTFNSQPSQNQKTDLESNAAPVAMAEAPAAPDSIAFISEPSNESTPAPQAIQSEQNGQSQQPTPQPSPSASKQERDSAAEALSQALNDEDAEVREQALFALANIGGPRVTEALIAALKDANAHVRRKAAWGLGMRHSEAAVGPLIDALKDSDADVRGKAAWALGMSGNSRAIEPLADALRDENEEVRQRAAWALGLRGDARVVEPLINALKDSSPEVRQMAAWALGMRGDKRAMKALNAAMKDQNKEVRDKASWALGMLLMRNGDSVSDDNDRNFDFDFEGRGSGSGSGSGAGAGAASGKGSGTGKSKARP